MVTHNYVDILQNMTNEQWPREVTIMTEKIVDIVLILSVSALSWLCSFHCILYHVWYWRHVCRSRGLLPSLLSLPSNSPRISIHIIRIDQFSWTADLDSFLLTLFVCLHTAHTSYHNHSNHFTTVVTSTTVCSLGQAHIHGSCVPCAGLMKHDRTIT